MGKNMSRGEKILRTIVYTCWIIALAVLLLFVAALVECELSSRRQPPEDIYADYKIHDYHLSVPDSAIGEIYGEYNRELSYDPNDPVLKDVLQYYFMCYKMIDGVDPANFVLAEITWNVGFPASTYPFVVQSPDMDIDVFSEWTVEDAVIDYVTDGRSVSVAQNGTDLHGIVLAMRDNFSEDIEFCRYDEVQRDQVRKYQLSASARSRLDTLLAEQGGLSICFTFKESDIIVWKAGILYKNGYLSIDVGTRHSGYTPSREYAVIEEGSPLYNAIIAALEAYAAE